MNSDQDYQDAIASAERLGYRMDHSLHCQIAGRELFEASGDIGLVLDGYTLSSKAENDLTRVIRPTWFYLCISWIVGCCGFAYFAYFVSPWIDILKEDFALRPIYEASTRLVSTSSLQSIAWVAPVVVFVWLVVGTSGLCGKLMLALGGRRYAKQRRSQWRAQACDALLAQGYGLTDAKRLTDAFLGGGKVKVDVSESDGVVGSKVEPSETVQATRRFSTVANLHRQDASDRLAIMRVVVPALLIALVGGVIVTSYCIVLFHPLVDLLFQLTQPPIERF